MQNAVEMPAQLQTQQPTEDQAITKEPSSVQDTNSRVTNGHNSDGTSSDPKENGGNETVTEPEGGGDIPVQPHGNSEVIKQQIRQNAAAAASSSLLANHKSEAADQQQFNDKFQPNQMAVAGGGTPQVNPMPPTDFYRNGDFGGPQQFEQMPQHQYPDQQQEISSITYGQPPPHHMQQVMWTLACVNTGGSRESPVGEEAGEEKIIWNFAPPITILPRLPFESRQRTINEIRTYSVVKVEGVQLKHTQ